jgi:hypothetical protein
MLQLQLNRQQATVESAVESFSHQFVQCNIFHLIQPVLQSQTKQLCKSEVRLVVISIRRSALVRQEHLRS